MTIKKGSEYGVQRPLPFDAPLASTDGELRQFVVAARLNGEPTITVGLLGGDLCKTLGGSGISDRLYGPDAITVPVDLVIAVLDGVEVPFVAHAIVGKPFTKDSAMVMNAQWLGDLDFGPRAHPGDGLIDITTGSLGLRERRLARSRAKTGTHLPHPSLSARRTKSETLSFDRLRPICIDGHLNLHAQTISFSVLPDAFFVVV